MVLCIRPGSTDGGDKRADLRQSNPFARPAGCVPQGSSQVYRALMLFVGATDRFDVYDTVSEVCAQECIN